MARGHKSTKIPGVRLRPAPAQDSSSSTKADAQAGKRKRDTEFEEEGGEGVEALNTVSRPFKGAVVCFTGVNDKPTLALMAKDLGATVESNLTDAVTHLVASDFSSEKYKVALELGFEIVGDNWLRASHLVWRDGGEVSLKESVQGHHLPIFRGLRICLSGFELGDHRANIIAKIQEQGGFISRTLDRSCTHLVTPTGTGEKVEWAQRANHDLTMAIVSNKSLRTVRYMETVLSADGKRSREVECVRDQTDIHIVWEEWVLDCLAAGGRWREDGYAIDVPREKLERKAIKKQFPTRGLRAHDSTAQLPVETSSAGQPPSSSMRKSVPSPLRRAPTEISNVSSVTVTTNGGDDAEPAVLKRLRRSGSSVAGVRGVGGDDVSADAHEGLMNEILGGVDLPLSQASQSRAGKGKKRAAVADLDDGAADDMPDARSVSGLKRTTSASSASGVTTAGDGSLGRARHGVASFSRSSSFTSRQPTLHRALSANSLHPDLLQPHVPSPIPEENEPRSSGGSSAQAKAADMPYSGKRFLIRCGKGRTQRAVVSAVLALGGQVLGDDAQTWGDGADYVVVKMRSGRPQPIPQLANWPTATVVTQHWVERCYRREVLLAVDSSVVHRPLDIDLPVPGASGVRLCPTKLDFDEQEFCRVLIEAFGGQFVGSLTRSITHLVCSPEDASGEKYKHAVNWGIPVLDPSWLEKTARTGRLPEVNGFWLGESRAKDSIDRGGSPPPPRSPPRAPAAEPHSLAPPAPAPVERARTPDAAGRRESLERPHSAFKAARAVILAAITSPAALEVVEPTTGKVGSASPQKVAAPTALAPKTAVSMPAPANPTTPSVTAPLQHRSNSGDATTPVAAPRSKSDVLPVSAGRSNSSAGGTGGKISPKPPAIAADVRAYIDRLEQEKRKASPVALAAAAGAFEERPVKRKRVLGRQGRTGSATSPSTGSASTSGASARLSGPPSPAAARRPAVPPSSFAPPNSPPAHSSDPPAHPADESQPLRVNWDDADARLARQRMLDSLARGAAAKRGEDVACIGVEYEEEVRRRAEEEESERLARELADRDRERGERRASTRRSSNRA